MSSGRYMAYSPSPSTAPQSPHLAGLLRSATSDLMEQEKYLTDLIAERQKLSPFVPVLPNSYRLLNQEILRVTTMLGTTSVIGQSGLEHANPLASGGLFPNGGADVNGWAPRFQSDLVFYDPYWLIDFANACIVLHLVGGYQIFSQPIFAVIDRYLENKFPDSGFINNNR